MTPVETQYLRQTKGKYPSVFRSVCAEKHFDGNPCVNCSNTLRYRSNSCCVECTRRKSQEQYRVNPRADRDPVNSQERLRRIHLKRAYGITLEAFNMLFAAQRQKCAACASPEPNSKNWHVDHCHKSGAVRGILCG